MRSKPFRQKNWRSCRDSAFSRRILTQAADRLLSERPKGDAHDEFRVSENAAMCACLFALGPRSLELIVKPAFLAEHGVFRRLNPHAESWPSPPNQKQGEHNH